VLLTDEGLGREIVGTFARNCNWEFITLFGTDLYRDVISSHRAYGQLEFAAI
jgi:hypothetical protein